jgi:putative ABC transport system substrate-binding protein
VIRRREFITLLGGAAVAWPLAARGQQPAMPVVGFLDTRSVETTREQVAAFKQGLAEAAYIEGRNVAIEYRWADNQTDRLPALASDLVRQRVAVIVAPGPPSALAAKAATTAIPIVFTAGEDPVRLGLVASLARPGGNVTGINWFGTELTAKRLELLRDLVPTVARVVLLVQPSNVNITELTVRNVETAARAIGVQIQVLNADTSREIDAAFATFDRERPDALFVGSSGFFNARRVQLAQWATYYRVPATYPARQYVEAGGLMSYGTSLIEAYREMGSYTGRILKGASPADLPVLQATKFELVINHQTARMLGLFVPPSLLALADEVIE